MPKAEQTELLGRFVTTAFEAGARLVQEGQEAPGLYIVASGEVEVVRTVRGQRCVVATLGVGDVVGEGSVLLLRPSSADVIARRPCVALHLPREGFLAVVRRHPALFAELYELAVRRDEANRSVLAQEAGSSEDSVLL